MKPIRNAMTPKHPHTYLFCSTMHIKSARLASAPHLCCEEQGFLREAQCLLASLNVQHLKGKGQQGCHRSDFSPASSTLFLPIPSWKVTHIIVFLFFLFSKNMKKRKERKNNNSMNKQKIQASFSMQKRIFYINLCVSLC